MAPIVLVGQLNLNTGIFGGPYSSSGAAKPKHRYFGGPYSSSGSTSSLPASDIICIIVSRLCLESSRSCSLIVFLNKSNLIFKIMTCFNSYISIYLDPKVGLTI